MSDVVFFLKAYPTQAVQQLPWPTGTKLVAIDPPSSCMCGGVDPRCSTAYSCLWRQTGSLQAFVQRYGHGATGRVAFAGFSAAHGFLNPLMESAADRAGVSALLLFDASFGGGKTGYQAAVQDAMAGRMLLVSTTGVTGGDASFRPVWQAAERATGQVAAGTPLPPDLPVQPRASYRLGDAFYLPFGPNMPHQKMGELMPAIFNSYLIPWWSGALQSPSGRSSDRFIALAVFAATVGAGLAARYLGYWR